MNHYQIEVDTFVIQVDPSKKHPLKCEYLSDSQEIVIRTPFREPVTVQFSEDAMVSIHFASIELRLSDDAIRKMFEALPPEMFQ